MLRWLGLGLFGVALLPCQVSADEMKTFIELGAEYTDNALRQQSPMLAEVIYTPRLRINRMFEYSAVDAELDLEARWTEYERDTFDDRLDITGTVGVDWSVVDGLLIWRGDLYRNRVALDRREVDTPSNETERTILSTGPELTLKLGPRSDLRFTLSFVDVGLEENEELELKQTQYRVDLIRRLLPRFALRFNVSRFDVKADDARLEYDNQRLGVGFLGGNERLRYSFEAGRNEIRRGTNPDVEGGFYVARIDGQGRSASWWVSGTRELTDSSIGLAGSNAPADVLNNGDGNIGAADVVDRRRFELGGSVDFSRLRLRLVLSEDTQDFQTLERDQETKAATLTLEYDLSRRLTASLTQDFENSTFELAQGGQDRFQDRQQRLELIYRPNERLTLTLWGRQRNRENDISVELFEESAGGLTLSARI